MVNTGRNMVPTPHGTSGKPGKWPKDFPCMENSWKIIKWEKLMENSWKHIYLVFRKHYSAS